MSADNNVFVAWEEHILSQEKGNRVVHFLLKNERGESVLAVVGTERSVRHMIYVVADEYLQVYGSEGFTNASTKWRARRQVVDWLTTMVSKHRPPLDISNMQTSESIQAQGFQGHSMAGISALQTHVTDFMVPRRLKVQNSDIVWSGVTWICSKQLRHYPAFCRNGTTIAVHSFVFIMAEEESDYVGYLEDLYEDKKGQKKVKVRWFHHSREINGVIPQLNPHPREVFITSHVQVISAECIDGPATVLTPKHYEKCEAIVSHTSSAGIHMCFRQFVNNKVKPFSLSKLQGYLNQAILSSLDCLIISKQRTKGHKSNGEDDDYFAHDGHAGQGAKRNRSCGENDTGSCGAMKAISGNQITQSEPTCKKLRIKLSRREPSSIKLVGPEALSHASFKVDEKIELLCQDSGIRGCWFRCKVLQTSPKRLKVQYVDVQNTVESGNLEEWVPAARVAAPDKLGMRCSGRLTIRPWPPEDSPDCSVEVGAPVDAWWSDGWWEGIVMGVDKSENDNLQIYFPGEDRLLTLQRKNIRTSRDFVDNKWLDVKAKPDVLALIPKYPTLAEVSECSHTASADYEVLTTKLEANVEVVKLSSSALSNDQENTDEVHLMKPICINDEDKVDIGGDSGDGCGNEVKPILGLGSANQKYEAVEEMEVIA
ncbi:DUF724 domain-containing protein [Actinidia chinensis var. chinensis]|uniref:DUF724 domain-containing protein n=1 Tax=Actinidia chinensis var. chinensis TaxID=1590841 RepID=A0A2R6QM02_ACTCC|nr:DUF724 domain-containing protein [Actinidia chinensis var. chinensis]